MDDRKSRFGRESIVSANVVLTTETEYWIECRGRTKLARGERAAATRLAFLMPDVTAGSPAAPLFECVNSVAPLLLKTASQRIECRRDAFRQKRLAP